MPVFGHQVPSPPSGRRPSRCLHRLALLWSNPAGLVGHRLGMGLCNRSARANANHQAVKGAAMLATLNSRQIVDEIVKDTVKDNDPHDAVQISPDVIKASRVGSEAPTLAPEFTARPEPKF